MRLKPCPFCGGEAEFETYGGTACAVTCRKCRCGTPTVSLNDGERAVEAWNRRERVTRCRDCAHYSDEIGGYCTLLEFASTNMQDGFCAWGEERGA